MRTPWCTSYFSLMPRRIEIVSSTVGSLTNTGWKRRASAASFSTCLRYSSSVVAPTQCNSPRASAGLSRLEASIAPSALPAPTKVCISSIKRMILPCAAVISDSTAFSRSSNSPRYFAPAISDPMSRAISRLSRRLFGGVEKPRGLGREVHLPGARAVHARNFRERNLVFAADLFGAAAGSADQPRREAFFVIHQHLQKVLRQELLIVVAKRERLG